MSTTTKTRDNSIDIIKAIAILAVVIGHACNTDIFTGAIPNFILRFVYIFHLPVFFYCSGYIYKDRPIKKRLWSILRHQYIPTTLFTLGSFILLPIYAKLQLTGMYSNEDIKKRITDTLVYNPRGFLVGALWFMPFFTVATLIFWILNIVSRKNRIVLVSLAVILGIIGVVYQYAPITKPYYLDYALRMQPILALGLIAKEHGLKDYIKKHSRMIACTSTILLLAVTYLYYAHGARADNHHTITGIIYFPAIIVGIAFCSSLAELISNSRISKYTVYIGQHTFIIMAMHFHAFKLVDLMLSKLFRQNYDMTLFPVSNPVWYARCLYAIVGLCIPLIIITGVRKIISLIRPSSATT